MQASNASSDMKLAGSVSVEWFAGMKNIFNPTKMILTKASTATLSYTYGPSLPRTVFFGFKIGNLL